MEATWLMFTCLISIVIFLVSFNFTKRHRRKLPPSPFPSLPVVGHIHLFQPPLHRTLHRLSGKFGPIFSLNIGARRVVVVSSLSAAEECFTKCDVAFSNRPHTIIGKHIGYNDANLIGAPYGDLWRNLRRVTAQEIFSPTPLDAFRHIRQDETKSLLKSLYQASPLTAEFARVELRPKLYDTVVNIVMRMVAGKRYFGEDEDSEERRRFQEVINEVFESGEASNPEDFFPVLRWIDWRRFEKKMAALGKRADAFYQGLIDEHRRDGRVDTVVGHLLSIQESQPQYYNDQIITGLMMNMIVAGIHPMMITIEWAMSILLNHPNIMQKARHEIDTLVGHDHLVDEGDMSQLHYLHCIISETMRMFSAGPMSLPRESSEDCKVGGYDIAGGTMLLVNIWAIHRDPTVWDEPSRFKPERFEGKEDAYEGRELMAFGKGRRSCPGSGLARRVVGLVLASLIQCFEWKRVSEDEEGVDLSEGRGINMPKAKPLEAMCKPRDVIYKLLSSPNVET